MDEVEMRGRRTYETIWWLVIVGVTTPGEVAAAATATARGERCFGVGELDPDPASDELVGVIVPGIGTAAEVKLKKSVVGDDEPDNPSDEAFDDVADEPRWNRYRSRKLENSSAELGRFIGPFAGPWPGTNDGLSGATLVASLSGELSKLLVELSLSSRRGWIRPLWSERSDEPDETDEMVDESVVAGLHICDEPASSLSSARSGGGLRSLRVAGRGEVEAGGEALGDMPFGGEGAGDEKGERRERCSRNAGGTRGE
ncbi:hypothetical protein BJY59DRAFT_36065 [Rhodotorula toruloides]